MPKAAKIPQSTVLYIQDWVTLRKVEASQEEKGVMTRSDKNASICDGDYMVLI